MPSPGDYPITGRISADRHVHLPHHLAAWGDVDAALLPGIQLAPVRQRADLHHAAAAFDLADIRAQFRLRRRNPT